MLELVSDGGQKSNNKDLDGVRQIRDSSREDIIITVLCYNMQYTRNGVTITFDFIFSHFFFSLQQEKKRKGWAFLAFNEMTID